MKQSANMCRDPQNLLPVTSDTTVFRQKLNNKAEVQTFFRDFEKELKLAPAQGSASLVTNDRKLLLADGEAEAKAKAEAKARVEAEAKEEDLADPKKFVYFSELPTRAKVMILELSLAQESEVICPFYCHGYKPDDTVFNRTERAVMSKYPVPAIWHKDRPNINLSLLEVSKSFRTLASQVFWRNHYFLFNDARSCLWFFKRIGKANMRQVHHAIFNLSSGFFLSQEYRNLSSGFFLSQKYRSESNICEEQRWCEVFELLKSNHQLWKCIVRFYDWNDLLPRDNLADKDKVQMTKGRLDLVSILAGFRGVGRVIVENDECNFLGEVARFQLARLMTATEEEEPLGSNIMEISVAETWFKHEYSSRQSRSSAARRAE